MKKDLKSELFNRLLHSLLPVLMGLWLPITHLYWLNASNLTLPFSVHLPFLGLLSALAVMIGLALQMLIPARFRNISSYFLLLTGVIFWAENTLFIGDFGFLQGGEMEWAENQHLLYFELILVVILLILFLKFKTRLIRNIGWITLALILSSLANIFPAFQANMARTKSKTSHTFTQNDIFRLSPEKNVILFIIDTYQADVIADIIAENLQWKNMLDGFTFFPNATSAFPKTYASIPNILTGQAYENAQPFSHFIKDAYLGNSAPKVLKENGFDVRYRSFTWQPYYAHPDVADNLAGIDDKVGLQWMQQHEFTQLANLTVFRLSPFLAKPWAYNQNEFRIKKIPSPKAESSTPNILTEDMRVFSKGNSVKDLEFLDQLTHFIQADSEKPTFRIFHLLGIHAKLKLDAELNYIGHQPITPETFREQAKGMLKLLSLAFDHLKAEGVYDNSLIFIVGDHGGGEYGNIKILQNAGEKIGLDIDFKSEKGPINNKLIRGAIPAILAKPAGKNGPLTISSSPVQLSDIPNTIFTEFGISKPLTGPSIFDIPENDDRIRLHRYYRFAGWGQDYIVPLTEYQISGFSWNPGSWSLSGRDLNSQAVNSFEGQLVVMGEGGNLDKYPHQGFSAPLSQGRKMSGTHASVTLPVQKMSGSMLLEIRTKPQYSPENAEPLAILINDKKIVTWTISKSSPFKFLAFVPKHLYENEYSIDIGFEISKVNKDPMIIEIRIIDHPGRQQYTQGTEISFQKGENSLSYLGSGWDRAEKWGTWTDGFCSMINLKIDTQPGQDLEMVTEFRPAIYQNAKPISVDVVANCEIIDSWYLTQGGSTKKALKIPGHLIQESQNLDISFLIQNPRQPRHYSQSTDKRFLALGFQSIVIQDPNATISNIPDIVGHEILFDNRLTTFRSGFNGNEDWNGKPVVWTQGMADLRMGIPPSTSPTAVQLTVELAPHQNGYLAAWANGSLVGAGSITTFPQKVILDLADVSIDNELRLVLYSTIRKPSQSQPVLKDKRRLGLALSSVKLTDASLSEVLPNSESMVLEKPYHLVLDPAGTASGQWSGVIKTERLDNIPATWISNEATVTVDWPSARPPRFLLIDVARTETLNSLLNISINGFPVLKNAPIDANWCQLIDITSAPIADHMTISLTSSNPVSEANGKKMKSHPSLSLALRQIVIVQ